MLYRSFSLALLASCLCASAVHAQAEQRSGTVLGIVKDAATTQPVEGAAVRVQGIDIPPQFTDVQGRFRFVKLPTGVHTFEIEHVAYGSREMPVVVAHERTTEVEARVSPSAVELEGIEVRSRMRNVLLESVGFYERAQGGWGHFIAGDRLRPGASAADLARMAPFVRLGNSRSSFDRAVIMQVNGRECMPELYVDGRYVGVGVIDNHVSSEHILGVEVYRSLQTPMQYRRAMQNCGAVVVWTRLAHWTHGPR